MMSENSTGPAECLSLHVGSSGFLTAWRPGATQSYDIVAQASKGKEAETASPCKNLGPDLSHSPGEKSPKAAQIEVGEDGDVDPTCRRESLKEFVAIFNLPHCLPRGHHPYLPVCPGKKV